MEQQGYLIDSNALIDFLGGKLSTGGKLFMNTVIDAIPVLSIITKIEVLGYPAGTEHEKTLVGFINECTVLPLTDQIAEICISIRKAKKIKLPDAILAATAIANQLTLITRNVSDFQQIDGLATVDPHTL